MTGYFTENFYLLIYIYSGFYTEDCKKFSFKNKPNLSYVTDGFEIAHNVFYTNQNALKRQIRLFCDNARSSLFSTVPVVKSKVKLVMGVNLE